MYVVIYSIYILFELDRKKKERKRKKERKKEKERMNEIGIVILDEAFPEFIQLLILQRM